MGKRILVGTLAVVVVSAWVFIPVACADGDEQESAVQVTETPVVDEVIVVEPEPVPEVKTVTVYDVPLDQELQLFIIRVCEDYHIEPSIVLAVIERESNFKADAVGDSGKSLGLMQIQARWHQGRMDKLGVTDLLDPYQNVLVGIDYLVEQCERFEDIEMALMAYNAGASGANKNWFSKGIYSNAYSQGVMERSRIIQEGVIEYAVD